jgi:hypothetical protein
MKRSFKVRSPRATISWMVQPAIFHKFMVRKGEDARGIGFLARCLICFPASTQGTRFIRSTPQKLDRIKIFQDRIFELLNDQVDLLNPKDDEDE